MPHLPRPDQGGGPGLHRCPRGLSTEGISCKLHLCAQSVAATQLGLVAQRCRVHGREAGLRPAAASVPPLQPAHLLTARGYPHTHAPCRLRTIAGRRRRRQQRWQRRRGGQHCGAGLIRQQGVCARMHAIARLCGSKTASLVANLPAHPVTRPTPPPASLRQWSGACCGSRGGTPPPASLSSQLGKTCSN